MIKRMSFACDNPICYKSDETEDFLSEEEALESGWFILRGPERYLGNGERVYCSLECLDDSL